MCPVWQGYERQIEEGFEMRMRTIIFTCQKCGEEHTIEISMRYRDDLSKE